MADAKISALVDGTTPDDADDFVVARAGSTLKLTWAALKSAIGGSMAVIGATLNLSADVDQLAGDTLPLDTAVYDSGGFADPANNRIVVPAGKGGIYHYGFSVACHATHGGNELEIQAVPSGVADLLIARWWPTFTDIFLALADSNVAPFSDGDHLAVIPNWSGGNDPWTITFKGGVSGSSLCKLFMVRLGDTPT